MHRPLRQLLCQSLDLGLLKSVEDDDPLDLVERGGELVGVDHPGHKGGDG